MGSQMLMSCFLLLLYAVASECEYVLVKQQKSFFEAEVYCETHGGHLASVHSHNENTEITNICHAANHDCWIGFTLVDYREYRWVDGSLVNFVNWHPGEPDNWNNVEKCAKLNHTDGTWSDQSCDAMYALTYFVCNRTSGSGGGQPLRVTTPGVTTSQPGSGTTHRVSGTSILPMTGGSPRKLQVRGVHFYLGGKRIFLSGMNQAWVAYGYDFGNSQYQYRRNVYEKAIREAAAAGANSVRVWIHIEGATTPEFDSNGYVTALDGDGTFISDMRKYIRYAAQHNMLVFPTLWNAAVKQNFHYHLDGLIKDTAKLQSYIDKALIPMVSALKNEPGVGGWDIINEAEGELKPGEFNSDACFDSNFLSGSGAGWAGKLYTIQEYLRFINWQIDAIRRTDPEAQVTSGAWSETTMTSNFGHVDIYKDECLKKAGGKQMGTLTFYSVHTYDWNRKYADSAPFKHNASDYGINKPIVIAEFNQQRGGGMTIEQQFNWAYDHGYAGAWSWSYMADGNWHVQQQGMRSIKDKSDNHSGGLVAITL